MLKTVKFILSHPLNRGRPLSTLARYAFWQIRSRLQDEVVVDWIEGTKLVARKGMTGATGNIYCGLHEYADMSFVLHLLRPGDLFVDVGANIGSYTVLASGVCGARTVAIEPDPGTMRHLDRNISKNGLEKLVQVRRTAVGDNSGLISFTTGQDTTNQVAKPDDLNIQEVPISRLNDILEGEEPTLIKFDVEGYETEALRGAKEVLERAALLAVLLETVDAEAREILKVAGFDEVGFDPVSICLSFAGEQVASNRLFVRNVETVAVRLHSSRRFKWRGMLF
jgi:FkbM family methyltransferase